MANDNTVNVEITASVAGLKSGLSQAEKGIKGFGTSTDKMISKTNKMAGAVKTNAVPSLTAFSQVIQDAPYGIRGVANNITQLTSQFGYLSKSTGGAGNALKAMIGSLTGPAGILLAVSLVTSLLVSYGDELANIGSASGKAAEKQKLLAESLESTSSVLGAQVDALDAQIKLLKAQKIPIKELLSDKLKLLEADLQTTVQQRTALVNQLEFIKAKSSELSLTQKIFSLAAKLRGLPETQVAGIDKEEQKAIDEIEVSISNATKSIADLSLAIGQIRSPEIFNPEKVKKNISETKRAVVEPLTALFAEDIPKLQEATLSGMGVDFWKRVVKAEELEIQKQIVLDKLNAFKEQSANIIQGGLAETFAGIGEGIGTALANGGNVLEAAGAGLLSGLGSIMVDLGKQAILTGITIEAVKKALKSLNGPLAIAAGVALVAAGSIFKATASKLGSSMGSSSGSTNYSSSGTNTNYRSSTSYASSSGTSGGTYVFEIAGTKLIGVLKNTLDRNKQLGGSNNLIFG